MKLKNVRKLDSAVPAMVIVGVAMLYVAWMQYHFWSTDPEYVFGFLTPLFVLFILKERWPQIKLFREQHAISGNPKINAADIIAMTGVFVSALLFFLGGFRRVVEGPSVRASFACSIALAGIILLGVFLFCKEDREGRPLPFKSRLTFVGLFLFPALVWMISSPMFPALEGQIRTFLLGKIVSVVFFVFETLAIPIQLQGNFIILPEGKGTVHVDEACSGIRSLTGCIFSGSFIAAALMNKLPKKLVIISIAILFAFIMNLFRSMFLTGWAYHYGGKAIEGNVHDISGYAVLGITTACLFGIALLIADPPVQAAKKT